MGHMKDLGISIRAAQIQAAADAKLAATAAQEAAEKRTLRDPEEVIASHLKETA